VPLDPVYDYTRYIDGKPRVEGVRSFLGSRHIELSEGSPTDPPNTETVSGLANRKHELVRAMIHRQGVHAFEGAVRFVHAARDAGLRCAVVSADANCREVIEMAGIADLFDARVDAIDAIQARLQGKPAPDMFLAAARLLDAKPAAAAVFEDSLAGVSAARSGQFGLVVGVNRNDHAEALKTYGADTIVSDLAELLG